MVGSPPPFSTRASGLEPLALVTRVEANSTNSSYEVAVTFNQAVNCALLPEGWLGDQTNELLSTTLQEQVGPTFAIFGVSGAGGFTTGSTWFINVESDQLAFPQSGLCE